MQSARSADRRRRGRLFAPLFGGAKSGSAAGPNSRLLPTAVKTPAFHPSSTRCNGALRFAALQSHGKGGFAAKLGWRMKQYLCPAGRPSRVSARQPTYFSCVAKRSRQEKATPEMPPRCAGSPRRWHRNREASETRCAQTADASLSVSVPADASPSNGDPRQRQRQKQRQKQKQLSLRGQRQQSPRD